jgi:hypothetical protein
MKKLIIIVLVIFSLSVSAEVSLLANYEEDIYLSPYEIRQMFTGQNDRWPNGTKVIIVLMKENNRSQREFIRTRLGLSVSYYYRIYKKNRRNVFYKELIHEKDMIDTLILNYGSIGLINDHLYYYTGDYLKSVKIK